MTSSNASGAETKEIWIQLRSSLLMANENMCSFNKKHEYKKESPVGRMWQPILHSRKYKDNRRPGRKVAAMSSDLLRLIDQMRRRNLVQVQGEKTVQTYVGNLCPVERAKAASLIEYHEYLSNVRVQLGPRHPDRCLSHGKHPHPLTFPKRLPSSLPHEYNADGSHTISLLWLQAWNKRWTPFVNSPVKVKGSMMGCSWEPVCCITIKSTHITNLG